MSQNEIADKFGEAYEDLMKKLPLGEKKKLKVLEECFNALRDIIEKEHNT